MTQEPSCYSRFRTCAYCQYALILSIWPIPKYYTPKVQLHWDRPSSRPLDGTHNGVAESALSSQPVQDDIQVEELDRTQALLIRSGPTPDKFKHRTLDIQPSVPITTHKPIQIYPLHMLLSPASHPTPLIASILPYLPRRRPVHLPSTSLRHLLILFDHDRQSPKRSHIRPRLCSRP